jgi:hypothetical protein
MTAYVDDDMATYVDDYVAAYPNDMDADVAWHGCWRGHSLFDRGPFINGPNSIMGHLIIGRFDLLMGQF